MGKVYWKNLRPNHTVKLAGSKGAQFYTTGSGDLIYWNGREAREAQTFLNKKVREGKRRRRK